VAHVQDVVLRLERAARQRRRARRRRGQAGARLAPQRLAQHRLPGGGLLLEELARARHARARLARALAHLLAQPRAAPLGTLALALVAALVVVVVVVVRLLSLALLALAALRGRRRARRVQPPFALHVGDAEAGHHQLLLPGVPPPRQPRVVRRPALRFGQHVGARRHHRLEQEPGWSNAAKTASWSVFG